MSNKTKVNGNIMPHLSRLALAMVILGKEDGIVKV